MIFRPLAIAGAFAIDPEAHVDARGSFTRLFCGQAFADHGLVWDFRQASTSYNRRVGTLRGLHLQRPPAAEAKLVRVTAGAVFDVLVDLRSGSPSYGQWVGLELSAQNRRQVYIPEGCAHGFQTLADDSEVAYQISVAYAPERQDGVRWNDHDLAIAWPLPEQAIISDRDRDLPPLTKFQPVRLR